MIAFVDDKNIADLVNSGLGGLYVIAPHGGLHQNHYIGMADNAGFVLSYAYGFNNDHIPRHGVQHGKRVAGRARQTTQLAP